MSEQKTIQGYLGADAVVRQFKSGKGDLVSFNVAAQNETEPGAQWYSCAVFEAKLKPAALALKKGDLVKVTGRFEEKEYNGNLYKNIAVTELTTPSEMRIELEKTNQIKESVKIDPFDLDNIPF